MKIRTRREKWTLGILAILCAGLAIYLIMQTRGVKAGSPRPAMTVGTTTPLRSPATSAAKGSPANEGVDLELLEKLQSHALPDVDRNPFEFGLTPAQKVAQIQQEKARAMPPGPPPPPPPPPITVKALGFTEDKNGKRKAVLTDDLGPNQRDSEQTYEVVEGQSFAGRYKCLKITPNAVGIEDEAYHQRVELPFPQSSQ